MIGFIAALGLLASGCVEPIEFEGEIYESMVVVEGTITNEEKNQAILLSTTYKLEEEGPSPLRNAEVRVIDDTGGIFIFEEETPGEYVSVNSFRAEEGRSYQLEFTTPGGRNYTSDPVQFSGTTIIEDVFAVPGTNVEGDPGIEIRVDGRGTASNTGYYRYEYEETYKIVSFFFKSKDIILDENGNIDLVPKSKEEYTCFKTDPSQNIVISNTNTLNEDNVQGELLRFIRSDNPIFAHRYSILVRQYGISREAYSFYQTLNNLSDSENLFSQVQPGYLQGNISSLNNPDENVLGFFSVSSVAEKRVFFNYTDFYNLNDGHRPTFTPYCPRIRPSTFTYLVELLSTGSYRFFEDLGVGPPTNSARYRLVSAPCVDCTLIGSNEVPEFWEE
ncbi:MAG TPA: DUF4249 domain-containing protein [Gillisia sp.]|nr:DUF4249 domain-containing protein [Gillisia sp.]